jgi:chemotaxis signal transduction protein
MTLLHEDIVGAAPVASRRVETPLAARVCVFTLDGERFALPVTSVREIAVVDHVTPVPRAAACVLGAINLRGTLVSVVTIEPLLGLTPRGPRCPMQAIVLAHPTMRVAVAVDEVVDMAALEESGPLTMLDPSTMIARLKSQEER